MEKLRNRLFACGSAAFILLNALPLQTAATAFAAEIEAASRGDINGDGKKDSADLEALTALLGKRPDTVLVDSDDLIPYDVTEDGMVDSRDTFALSQFVSGAAKELPNTVGKKLTENVTLTLESAACFPGDEFQVMLSFVDWSKDIAAYDITIGFDTALTLKNVEFLADDCQFVPASRTVKLTGLHKDDPLHRGDFAVLTFTAPKNYDGDFGIAVEGANIFTSTYDAYTPIKPTATVTVYPLAEPVALQAAGIGSQSVSLAWDMPFTDQPVTGYRVYRGSEMIAETTDTSYTDTGLKSDTDYEYSVSAVTNSGTETAKSLPLTVHTAGPKIRSAAFPAETVSNANSDLTIKMEQAAPLKELKLDIKGPDGKTTSESVKLEGKDLDTINYHWDVSKLADGAYTFVITVTDLDGAAATAEAAVKVTGSPLKALTLKGTAGDRTAQLSWSLADEASVTGYIVYRLNDDGKTWDKIAEVEGRNTLTYTDTKLTAGKTYTYSVSSRNSYGQESPKSTSVKVTPNKDSAGPEITLFKPAGGQRVSGEITVTVGASDENGVASVRCEISADEGKTWKTIGETEGDSGKWVINTADYKDGVYQLRAMAADSDKNESNNEHIISLAFDNTAPEQVKNVHTVSLTETEAVIGWDDVADEDFAYFMAIISDNVKTWEKKIDKTLGITLSNLTADTPYTLTVYAVDAAGNAGKPSETFSFVSSNDKTAPTISSIGVSSEYASANTSLTVNVTAKDQSQVTFCYLQYSQDQKKWTELKAAGSAPTFNLYDKKLTEGKLYLRAYAEDQFGNKGDPEKAAIRTLTVDNTAPAAPEKVTASVELRSNLLSWTASADTDVTYYRIDRGTSENGSYSTLGNTASLNYEDKNVQASGTYYYRVYAIDRAGNLSAATSSGLVQRVPDTEKPTITECSVSRQNLVCSAHHSVQIMATDNTKVESISAAYRCSDTAAWTALKTVEIQANKTRTELIVRAELPESVLKEKSVTVQVTAADSAGNKFVKEFTFVVDDSKAEITKVAVKLEEKHIVLSWECADASGVSSFYVYRKIGANGKEICFAPPIIPQKDQKEFSVNDTDLTTGGDLYYRIEAVMKNGNTVSFTTEATKIQAIPKAELDYTPSQVVGAEYSYDARSSQNAADITLVTIDFGDGTKSIETSSVENALFTHTYQETGEYTVTLTVTNKSGMTDKKTVTVSVAEKSVMSTVNVHVVQMDGTPAAYATVYKDVGTDQQTKYQTDANGNVTIECTAGNHEFGVFANGCLPATKYVVLAPDSITNLNFTIAKDELVKADFEVTRMSLEEIKAAGIDVKDPENCQMVMIDVALSYTITSTVREDHITIYYDSNSGRSWVGGNDTSNYHYEVQSVSRDVNTVVMMRVPAKVQFLKEFFKVDMIVMNNASGEFSLANCTASLNLPNGLTLMEGAASSQPRVADIGTIGGGEQKTISWVVRGDRSGTYNFSADFSGTLMPFNEHVAMTFNSEKPINVKGQEAATITVNFDPVIRQKNLLVEMLVENNTSIDLNELSTDIGQVIADTAGTDADGNPKATILQTRFTDTDGIQKVIKKTDSITVLRPGQKFSVVYCIRNVLGQDIPGHYKKTKQELSYAATSRNVTVQIKPVHITDVNDPAYGISFDPATQFILLTRNKNGDVIKNASVELGTVENGTKNVIATGYTDDIGRLVVPRGEAGKKYYIIVTADDYKKYQSYYFLFPAKTSDYFDIVTLSGDYSGQDFSMRFVTLSTSTHDTCNLLTQRYTINTFENETFSIIGASEDPGTSYELIQKGESKAIKETEGSSGTFAFMELTPSMFVEDKPVVIRVHTATGDVFETTLTIDVISVSNDNPLESEAVQNAMEPVIDIINNSDLVGTAPASVNTEPEDLSPFVLDLSFTFSTPGDKIQLSGPVHPEENNYPTVSISKEDDTTYLDFSLTRGRYIAFGFSYSTRFNYTVTFAGKMPLLIGKDANSFKLEISIAFNGSLYYKVPCAVYILPEVFLALDISAGITGTVSLERKYTGLESELNSEGSITVNVTLIPMLGVGCHRVLEGGIKGTANIEGKAILWPDAHLDKITLDGSFGVYGTFLDITFLDVTIFRYPEPITLYDFNKPSSLPPRLMLDNLVTENGQTVEEAINDASMYKPFTAEMIPQAGEWNAQLGDGLTELQSGISGGSAPMIVSDGTNTLMVWIVKDAARGVDNAPYAVWSRYDSTSKTWSAPAAVDDNKNADTKPVLFAGADGIRIAYLESGTVYEEGNSPALEDYAKQLVLKTAKFDPEAGAFTDFRTVDVNAEGGFASAQTFVQAADGTTYLFWNSNANGNIFGNDNSNRILYAKETEDGWDTPVVLADELPAINSFACGLNADGKPVCAYTIAEPTEENTSNTALYLIGLSGEAAKLSSGLIGSPQFAKIPGKDASGLVWYQDGGLYASADLTTAEEICGGTDCRITDRFAIAGDRILFLSNIDNASALFSTQFDAESGKFTTPVCIESGENLYYEKLSLANVNDETLYAMSRTAMTAEESAAASRTSLVGGILGESSDIRISEPSYVYADAAPGKAFPISAEVFNDGTTPVKALTMQIKDAEGKVIATETKEISIISGSSANVEFAPVLPETLAPAAYTISVIAADTDRTPDNNNAALDLTKTDIALSTHISYIGNKTFVTVFAENLSNVPSTAMISIQPDQAEEATVVLYSDSIAPHSSAYWQLNAEDLLGDLYCGFINITADTETEDGNTSNNSASAFIAKSGIDPYKTGDINLDGKVELNDAMLALQCYTNQLAYLKDTGLNYAQQNAADVDRNGVVDVVDSMLILQYYVASVVTKQDITFEDFLAQQQNGGANHESE